MVYTKPPVDRPEWVLDYLGRYTHRIAISNHRFFRWPRDLYRKEPEAQDHGERHLGSRRVYSPFSAACFAQAIYAHPPLRFPGEPVEKKEPWPMSAIDESARQYAVGIRTACPADHVDTIGNRYLAVPLL
nr:hypothetical protein [uncultured bacterium]